jgi:hypothetical protein
MGQGGSSRLGPPQAGPVIKARPNQTGRSPDSRLGSTEVL